MSTFISYAQNFEDVLLWRALKHVESGFYIDIGANSPIVDSVSLAFYQKGWRGINVEPSLEYILELRDQREKDINVQAAVSEERGLLKFYDIPETGLSTLLPEVAASHAESGFEVRETVVPVVTLDDLLQDVASAEVHWMKIDVEGAEQQVLKGWKTSPIRPWVVVVESVQPTTHAISHGEWESILQGKGYHFVHFDGLNRYFISENHLYLADALLVGPNVFDRFCLSGTATSTFCAVVNHELLEAVERQRLAEERSDALDAANQENSSNWTAREESLLQAIQKSEQELASIRIRLEEAQRAGDNLQAGLTLAEREKNALRKQMIDTLSEYRSLIQDRNQAQESLNQLVYQLSMSKAEIEALKTEQGVLIADLRHSVARIESREVAIRALEGRVTETLNSTSWKVTAPLRFLSSMLHGSRNDASAYFRETLRNLSEVPALMALGRRILPEQGRLKRYLASRIATGGAANSALLMASAVQIEVSDAAGSERSRLLNKMAKRIRDDRFRMERTK